jgi:enoyl-CoA hydratase/carnithine racemase
VSWVVPRELLMKSTLELAHKVASKAPIAVRLALERIRRGLNWSMKDFLEWHASGFTFCTETEDHVEGSEAFIEKRQPVFKGK